MMRLFCVIPVVDLDGMHHLIIAFGKTRASSIQRFWYLVFIYL